MIITLSGNCGAGKSTVAKLLAEKLGYKFYSMGALRGKLALELGLTIDELNKIGEEKEFTDKKIDAIQKSLGRKENNFVVDGRLAFHFIPHSLKIFLKVDPQVAAERLFKEKQLKPELRPDEKTYESIDEAEKIVKQREQSDVKRYLKWYGVDFLNPRHYHLIIDTSNLTPEEIVEKILDYLKNFEF